MNCQQAQILIGPYLDGEVVDLVHVQEIEAHLQTCSDCSQEKLGLEAVRAAVREKATYFGAPDGLEGKILSLTGATNSEKPIRFNLSRAMFAPALVWVSGGLLCCLGFFLIQVSGSRRLETELIADHFRSLQASHLFDVPSSDKHTVKPWFQGKLDFSPDVPDLAQEGFPLAGGRLDYLGQSAAAALVYHRGKHVINVLVTRHISNTREIGGRDGYHIVGWNSPNGTLDYWAISDVNATDLGLFAQAFQASTARP